MSLTSVNSNAAVPAIRHHAQRWQSFVRRFLRVPMAVTGLLLVLLLLTVTVLGEQVIQYSDTAMDYRAILTPPTHEHWFGTDDFGRDVLSRTLAGTRLSFVVAGSVLLYTIGIGVVLGLIAGYYRSLDNVIMRSMDAIMAFPAILVALAIISIVGPRTENVVFALVVVYGPRMARLVRGSVLSLRELEYVEAARALGATDLRIIVFCILPGSVAPILVQGTFIFGYAILGEASLSFLGVGTPPPAPSLGNIISDARPMLREAPWMALYPATFMALLILSLNLLGDGLRDVLDPR